MIRWPSGFEAERFLREHWQKSPCLIRGVCADFSTMPSPEELAGLACEDEVESRIVHGDLESGWRVRHGPFGDDDFLSLPDSLWTLLVQDVEKHVPSLTGALGAFDFLPRWRLDDVMLSYAVPGGSVGPHIDAYDVFLLQAKGRRTWALDLQPADVSTRDDSDLRVLNSFSPTVEHVLDPGDLLYLPPGVAHYGVSESPGMTCSIGFRAPSAGELLVCAGAGLDPEEAGRYADPDMTPDEVAASRISTRAVERVRALMESATAGLAERAPELLGRLVTENKPWLMPEGTGQPMTADEILRRLACGSRLSRHPGSRFAWFEDAGSCWLFVNGKAWKLPAGAAAFCRRTADGPPVGRAQIDAGDPQALRALTELVSEGFLSWVADE